MQRFHNILIPTDFSQAAWNAVQLGLSLACTENSRITLLHVYPSSAKFTTSAKNANSKDDFNLKELYKDMNEFCDSLRKNSKSEIIPVVVRGKVEKEILTYLGENAFDMVILGVNSNGTDNHPGSHVSAIIEKANAPVLVIPNQLIPETIPA